MSSDSMGKPMDIPIRLVDPNPFQPRHDFGDVKELQKSIENHGLIQRIVVRREGDRCQIKAGHRRFQACKNLKWKTIPAEVVEASDLQMITGALAENMQRNDLSSVEREDGIFEAWEMAEKSKAHKSKASLARELGKDESYVREVIAIKEYREKNGVTPDISTESIKQVRTLNPEIGMNLLDQLKKDKITTTTLKQRASILKGLPDKLQEAVLDGKVDWDTAEEWKRKGIPSELDDAILESYIEKESDAVMRHIKRLQAGLNKIDVDTLRKLKTEPKRQEAIQRLEKIRKSANELMEKIEDNLDAIATTFDEVF